MRTKALLFAVLATFSLGASSAVGQATPGWREPNPENVWVIDTNKGRIIAELEPRVAPQTVERIKVLTRRKFYDGLTFFRVIDEFMAQTGDPNNTGEGDSDLPSVPAEFTFKRGADTPFVKVVTNVARSGLIGVMPATSQPDMLMSMTVDGRVSAEPFFCAGTLGMARASAPNSGNSQFFIMRQNNESVKGEYSAFGRVLKGLDVVRAIKTGEPVAAPQDRMITVQLLADMPAGQRPRVLVRDMAAPVSQPLIDAQKAAKGSRFHICDLDIEAVVQ